MTRKIISYLSGIQAKFFVPYQLPSLNKIIAAAKIKKGRWWKYADLKKLHTENIANILGDCKPLESPVFINFFWASADRRTDPDNIAAARKFILDGAVTAGLLEDDGWKHIEGFSDSFRIDKKNPGVYVEMTSV